MPGEEQDRSPEMVLAELRSREPIFHRPEHGTDRAAFEAMTVPDYWEVGASGRIYDRATVLAELDRRYADPGYDPMAGLEVSDFSCRALGGGTWLTTYQLRQDDRDTRRVSVWRQEDGRWVLVYHQGTVIEP
jgi:hypothetical protein